MSQMQEPNARVPDLGAFRLGDWSVSPAEGTLGMEGHILRLEPRVMDLLVCLAAEPGRVVSKEDLLAVVWGGAFVEEGVLSQAVHSLRKALGDDARQGRYIQTIPKRGYRLVAPVVKRQEPESVPASAALAAEPTAGTAVPSPVPLPLVPSRRSPGWVVLIVGGIATIVALWMVGHEREGLARSASHGASEINPIKVEPESGNSLVVLPFEELNAPENSFFADGLNEEITKDLASIPSLRVISRMTAAFYRGKSLPEIKRDLNVNYVLEGTVQWERSGDRSRVRIFVKLIQADDEGQIWAESFDREMKDLFQVQTEISQQVISLLDASLMLEERKPRPQPTENLDAYRAYLRGREIRNQPFYSEKHVRESILLFQHAVDLDPTFATAWAELSQSYSYLVPNIDPSPDQLEERKSRQAMERALALAPNLPEARIAHAYFTYRCLKDYATAESLLQKALRLSPNDPEVLQTLGFVLRRRGRMVSSIAHLQKALWLSPKTLKLEWAIAETYRAMRNHVQAERYWAHASSLASDQVPYWEDRALNLLSWKGDIEAARQLLLQSPVRETPSLMSAYFMLDFYDRQYERALGRLSPEILRQVSPHLESKIRILSVLAREALADHKGALAAAEVNRTVLAARVERLPREPYYQAYLAVTLAQLGRREEAFIHMTKALSLTDQDAFKGPCFVEIQAMMETILGDHQQAIHRLADLLSKPYRGSITTTELRLNPVWDSLREDPAFEELTQ